VLCRHVTCSIPRHCVTWSVGKLKVAKEGTMGKKERQREERDADRVHTHQQMDERMSKKVMDQVRLQRAELEAMDEEEQLRDFKS
jgi:hypothetical protein